MPTGQRHENDHGCEHVQAFPAESVEELFHSRQNLPLPTDVVVDQLDLSAYDDLLILQETSL